MFALVNGAVVVFGPSSWAPAAFNAALRDLGLNVSLPQPEPAVPVDLGNGVQILPVTNNPPAYDPASQCLVPGVPVVSGQTVQMTYSVQPLTAEQIAAVQQAMQSTYQAAVQAVLDSEAQTRNYDGILSACTYADDPNPKFAAEGTACRAWRSAVWAACYQTLDAVKTGTTPIPAVADFLAALPKMVWPA